MHITTDSPVYQKAFEQYLRRGTPIEISLKMLMTKAAETRENHTTTHYIWRTAGDSKVRPSHAANNGKIFAWDNPPPTGHPGEDFGCRCTAEPYIPDVKEFLSQTVTSPVNDSLRRWAWYDFVLHYYLGDGSAVRLSDVGHLQDIISVSQGHVFKGVERQVLGDARKVLSGSLNDTFKNTYPFGDVSFVHGRSTVEGRYNGSVSRTGNALNISVDVAYHFSDVFTDPLDIRESNNGTSDPRALQANALIDGEIGGQFYTIDGSWTTRLTATILT